MNGWIRHFKNEKGATAAEYVILAGLIAIAIIVGAAAIGTSINIHLDNVAGLITGGS